MRTNVVLLLIDILDHLEVCQGEISTHLERQESMGWLSRSTHDEIQKKIDSCMGIEIFRLRKIITEELEHQSKKLSSEEDKSRS